MTLWDNWKQGFDAWENVTAQYLEKILNNPAVLGPSGHMLAGAMRAKAKHEAHLAQFWATLGLPTRRDQERTLHAINQLNSRIIDLEEQLAAANTLAAKPAKAPKVARSATP